MQYLLTICIPTYNRSSFLSVALEHLCASLSKCTYPVEVIISDNHSTDDTPSIIEKKISDGLVCRYVRNEQNIGPDANFIQCFEKAMGEYVWLIGDDDYLKEDSIQQVCELLSSGNYGLVHIDCREGRNINVPDAVYDDTSRFLSDVNVMITFISGNIICKDSVHRVNGRKYLGSYLAQVPYFIGAASMGRKNMIVSRPVLECGANVQSNGGYNFAKVFFDNYLGIISRCIDDGIISKLDYASIKRSTFVNFYHEYVFRTLIGRPSQSLDMSGCVRASIQHYWLEPYSYRCLLEDFCRLMKGQLKRMSFRKEQ